MAKVIILSSSDVEHLETFPKTPHYNLSPIARLDGTFSLNVTNLERPQYAQYAEFLGTLPQVEFDPADYPAPEDGDEEG